MRRATSVPAGGGTSTYLLYKALKEKKRFVQVKTPERGDIIISPSGYGNSRKISNGHVGIISDNGWVMSNNSDTGLWSEHIKLEYWYRKYRDYGKYPVLFFRLNLS